MRQGRAAARAPKLIRVQKITIILLCTKLLYTRYFSKLKLVKRSRPIFLHFSIITNLQSNQHKGPRRQRETSASHNMARITIPANTKVNHKRKESRRAREGASNNKTRMFLYLEYLVLCAICNVVLGGDSAIHIRNMSLLDGEQLSNDTLSETKGSSVELLSNRADGHSPRRRLKGGRTPDIFQGIAAARGSMNMGRCYYNRCFSCSYCNITQKDSQI